MSNKHTHKMLRICTLLAAIILVCFIVSLWWRPALLVTTVAFTVMSALLLIEGVRHS